MQPGRKSGEEGSFGEEVPILPTIISQGRIWHSKMIKVALVDFLWEFTLESNGREAAPPLQSGWESGIAAAGGADEWCIRQTNNTRATSVICQSRGRSKDEISEPRRRIDWRRRMRLFGTAVFDVYKNIIRRETTIDDRDLQSESNRLQCNGTFKSRRAVAFPSFPFPYFFQRLHVQSQRLEGLFLRVHIS